MSRLTTSMVAAVCVATTFATTAQAEDAKNPLIRPRQVKLETVAASNPSFPPAPALKDKLLAAPGSTSAADVANHLAQLRVVATVGNKAILRGPLGKTGNVALVRSDEPGNLDGAGGLDAASTSATQKAGTTSSSAGAVDTKTASLTRTLTFTSGESMQLADGLWVRAEVVGASVRLYMQPSASAKDRSEALVYSSSVEIASPTASRLTETTIASEGEKRPSAAGSGAGTLAAPVVTGFTSSISTSQTAPK